MHKTSIFIEKARAKHGDRYGYGRVVYVRSQEKVIITCTKHGDFEQRPAGHLAGKGCYKCGIESMAVKQSQEAKDDFIEKARAAHGDKYDYDRVVYVRSRDKVVITCAKHGDFYQTPKNHLSGSGCSKCAGVHRYSTQEWIQEAIDVHGDHYSYDRVVYVRDKDKVIITCKKHGDFEQIAGDHLAKKGCAKCGNEAISIKLSQEAKDNFIERSRARHGDKYDYLKTVYFRSWDKVIITCKQHGDFEQIPRDHLQGKGCAKCGKESMAIKLSEESKDSFVERSRAVHGDRYDYSKVVYVRSYDKVIMTCKNHGDFEQTPKVHLKGSGCAKCGVEEVAAKKTEEPKNSFIARSRAVHGVRYDYSKVLYIRSSDKVVITCKIHGDFEQIPNSHLSGRGCPSCPRRYDQPSSLYLMHNGLGKVKVGYAIDLNRRITELNSSAPFEAELLETWTLPDTPTVRKIEGRVHRKLAKYHAGLSGFDGASEWFNASPDTARKHILKALSGAEVLSHRNANSSQLSLI